MKISLLSLIVGIILGVLIIGLLYYGAYKSFEIYFKIRHPFKKSSAEGPLPESEITTPPKNKLYISEWMNIPGEDEYISKGDVYLFNKNKIVAIDETRKFLKLTDFNSTDSLQKWKLFFFKNPNNPFENTGGIIYNEATHKYISFENGDISLKDLEESYGVDSFNVEVIQYANKLSDKFGEWWITNEESLIKSTKNEKNAMEFSVAVI